MSGFVANLASHIMNSPIIMTPKIISRIAVGEVQDRSPLEPVSSPYKKQIVPPMMSKKPIQSILLSPFTDSFSRVRLRLKKSSTRTIPSKGRLI